MQSTVLSVSVRYFLDFICGTCGKWRYFTEFSSALGSTNWQEVRSRRCRCKKVVHLYCWVRSTRHLAGKNRLPSVDSRCVFVMRSSSANRTTHFLLPRDASDSGCDIKARDSSGDLAH